MFLSSFTVVVMQQNKTKTVSYYNFSVSVLCCCGGQQHKTKTVSHYNFFCLLLLWWPATQDEDGATLNFLSSVAVVASNTRRRQCHIFYLFIFSSPHYGPKRTQNYVNFWEFIIVPRSQWSNNNLSNMLYSENLRSIQLYSLAFTSPSSP